VKYLAPKGNRSFKLRRLRDASSRLLSGSRESYPRNRPRDVLQQLLPWPVPSSFACIVQGSEGRINTMRRTPINISSCMVMVEDFF